jgi:hypothetical protein
MQVIVADATTGIALMSFLKYAEIYEAHRIAALAWSSLGRPIQIELALEDEGRGASSREQSCVLLPRVF